MQESAFGTAGLTEVLLPSGYRVRGIIPGLPSLARRGLLDTRVQQAVVRIAAEEHTTTASDDTTDWQTTADAFVAGFPREALDPGEDSETGEWKPATLTVDDLDTMDQRDRQALQALVLRMSTAEEITAASETGDEEDTGELDRLAEFRDDADGAAHRDDGEGVGPASVDTAAGGG